MKKKVITLLIIAASVLSIAGCGQKEPEKYEITDKIGSFQEASEDTVIDFSEYATTNIIYDLCVKYNGIDLSHFLLREYHGEEFKTLSELIKDKDKPTLIINISPYCASCKEVDYESVELLGKYNIIYTMSTEAEITDEFDEKGISSKIMAYDADNLADNKADSIQIRELINEIGNPSFIYLTKEGKIAFISMGDKDYTLAKKLIKYLE